MKLTRKEANRLGAIWGAAHHLFTLLEGLRPGAGFETYIADDADTGKTGPASPMNMKAPEDNVSDECKCRACSPRRGVRVWEHNMSNNSKDALIYLLQGACNALHPKIEAHPKIEETLSHTQSVALREEVGRLQKECEEWKSRAAQFERQFLKYCDNESSRLAFTENALKERDEYKERLAYHEGLLADAREVLGHIMAFCWPAPKHYWRGDVNMKGLIDVVTPVIYVLRNIAGKPKASVKELVDEGYAAAPVTREEIAQVIYGNAPEYRGGPPLSPDDYAAAAERVLKYFNVERKVL